MLNEYYQNIGIKGFIERYGLVNALKRGIFMATPIHMVNDYEMKKILWQKHASKKIEKYIKYAEIAPDGIKYKKKEVDDPIWIFWNTGMGNAPEIIKKCYESVKKNTEKEIIVLDEQNVEEYIVMPECIELKKKQGKISLAIYADLIRFCLLAHYGGIWIDATVYMTDEIPKEIIDSDFWTFQNSLGLVNNPALYPVWFIRAKKDNEIIKKIRNIAFAFWMKNSYAPEYLLSNIIFTKVLSMNEEYTKKMPYMNSDYSEYLVKKIGEEYTEEKFEWIKKMTSIHKITYKLDPTINKKGSIYRYILEH